MLYVCMALFYSFQATTLELKGVATRLDSKEPLYLEVHNITLNPSGLNQRIETKYFKPDGTQFAEMTSDFSKHPTVPEVKFTDLRFKKSEQITLNKTDNVVVFKSITENEKANTKEIKLQKHMAAAQGFDNFVKINFDKLSTSTVPLSFGVLSEMDFFSFNGYKRNDVNTQIVQFGIKLRSLLYRLFASELVLEYDTKTKQILSYKGLSNLLADDGKTQNVHIRYEHSKETEQ